MGMGNLLGSSNEAKVLAEWNEKQSEQFIECFNKYNQRFGWGDPMNSFYIQRSVIYTGDKDRVLAKYDDFVQNSLLAKSDRQDIVVTVPMPDIMQDSYLKLLYIPKQWILTVPISTISMTVIMKQ